LEQEINFVKLNPTQNMTILVETTHPTKAHKDIATRIMSYDSVYAEQVGFIEEPINYKADAHLQMAGGEFCGNACMALAAFITSKQALKHNHVKKILLEVSGTDSLVECEVKRVENEYYCQVTMPIPKEIKQTIISHEGNKLDVTLVDYGEFVHIVMNINDVNERVKEEAQSLAKSLSLTLNVSLIGILLYNQNSNELEPLIYIPHLDSMVWEKGCGSGTASLGSYLAWKNKKRTITHVKQPGGIITAVANYQEGKLISLKIEGFVGIVAQGKAFITV
jgi:diaminopimelate epimerase